MFGSLSITNGLVEVESPTIVSNAAESSYHMAMASLMH